MDDMNSVRCKACDTKFNTNWCEETKTWEDMCWTCIGASMLSEDTDLDECMFFLDNEGVLNHE